MLSNDNKTLIIYSLSYDLRGFYYKCDIFKCVKEDFEFEFEINLTESDVPLQIYSHAILTQLRNITTYIESSPNQENGYERYINKMIRIRAIDDILENIP